MEHETGAVEAGERDTSPLAGGGEMGALMRSIDWSNTPLGPVSDWSQALRTMVGVLLRNRFPLILLWGPQFVQLYNDPYRPILGAKHPKAMGQAAPECWSEIWHVIGPMFQAPLSGEPATWSDDLLLLMDRKGFIEETHFKVAYSPVPDETVTSTGVGGVLATVAEITEQVYGERQLRTLRELGARAAAAKTPEEACATAAATLGGNPRDVLFALLYLLDDAGRIANLAGACGLVPGEHPAAPRAISLVGASDAQYGWPLRRVLGERQIEVIDDLGLRFGQFPASDQRHPPQTAIVLPLGAPDQPRVYGFVIVGVSPHRSLDEGYRSFFEVAAAQVVTAIRNARAYQEERKRAEALAEIDRAKTAFFSNVSHEFRTPLTLMLGPEEEALRSPGRALAGEALDAVHRNTLRLLKLVNTLLDFSRVEAGRARALYEPTDLAALTSDLASAFRSAMERGGLDFQVDCAVLAGPVYVDREMWEKIVLNLISNAFKFTFEGRVRVTLRPAGERVELVVSDSGVGIPEDSLDRVFERFYRIEGTRSRTYEGSGIGLALVNDLVKLHGGTINVASQLSRGTTFTVSLPMGAEHLSAEQIGASRALTSTVVSTESYVAEALRWLPSETSPATVPPALNDSPPSAGPALARVLVVDDNADMRDHLVRLLRPHWTVEAVADGDQALAAVSLNRPDLVLTDVMMPNLDGFGLLRALRNSPSTEGIPVVMLSARAGDESSVEGLQAGADDYLIKPFSTKELLARVATHLELARLRRAAESERQKLNALFEQAPAAICVLRGPEMIVELANDDILEVWGKDESRVLGRPLLDALPEIRGQSFPGLIEEVMRTGIPHHANEALAKLDRNRNGVLQDVYFNFTYQPFRGSDGQIEGIMVFAFEVTAQVQARQRAEALAVQLQASQEALRSTEQQFRTLADTMPILAWYANPDGFIPWYNQRWYEYTGTKLEQQEGWKWEAVHDPQDLPRVVAKWKVALACGQPWEDQFRLRRHDGQLRWFLSRAIPLRDPEGKIVRWFGTNVDIDNQKRAEATADAANRAKDEFLAVLGHELRNPLAPILTALHLMRLRGVDKLEKERGVIERQAHHLVRLVDDLLDVSRITRGKVELKKQRIELAEIVAKAIEMASPLLETRQQNLTVDVASRGLAVDADPVRLGQVLANLLTNAAKYTEQGGDVRIAASRANNEIILRVRDTGIGIAPEMLPKVFDMFVQERQALDRSQGGLGLGLTIVRSLVTLHDGTIAVHSKGRGQGSEFIVRLPAAAEQAPAVRNEVAASTAFFPRATAGGRRVLVVDDNHDAAEMLAASLEAMGHSIRVAHDGPDAIKSVGQFAPDIALLDIGLPVMDGYELARRLRDQEGLKRLRLVAITGYGQESDQRRVKAAGFDAHMVKPVNLDRLDSVIRELTV